MRGEEHAATVRRGEWAGKLIGRFIITFLVILAIAALTGIAGTLFVYSNASAMLLPGQAFTQNFVVASVALTITYIILHIYCNSKGLNISRRFKKDDPEVRTRAHHWTTLTALMSLVAWSMALVSIIATFTVGLYSNQNIEPGKPPLYIVLDLIATTGGTLGFLVLGWRICREETEFPFDIPAICGSSEKERRKALESSVLMELSRHEAAVLQAQREERARGGSVRSPSRSSFESGERDHVQNDNNWSHPQPIRPPAVFPRPYPAFRVERGFQ